MNHYKELNTIILELKATNACKHAVEALEVVTDDLKPCTIERATQFDDMLGQPLNDLNKMLTKEAI